ncbi:MAG: DUF309 domain-containing protein [Campylobacterota bacterium]|nr:DUF309 domain-containing protein [Campylobacterota bacterium]
MEKLFDIFINMINEKKYAASHEILEPLWLKLKKEKNIKEAKLIQGIINGAVSLALYYEKNRIEPANRIWKVFEKYIYLVDELDLEYNKYILKAIYTIKEHKKF